MLARRRSSIGSFPAHLPRERVVIEAPTSCSCCGSDHIVKMGCDITETLEVIPRQWTVIQPLFAPDRAREVHLQDLREDQPGEEDQTIFQCKIAPTNGAFPCHPPRVGRSTSDRDGCF
jgi:hypothetical protein